ncbi:MAG TPA: PAS domain S-box protein [Gemmatimonadales bacterium]|nr:PAS domain S-box protein [Gemmatimonadales bacterium]
MGDRKQTNIDRAGEPGGALPPIDEPFRILVEGVVDYAIFMLDPDGRVVSWNPGAERINGYSAREIIGQHFSRFYPPEDLQADKPARELAIATAEGKYEEEGWRVRKDGSWFWANVLITAVRDPSGRLRGFAKVTRDLTERREAAANLERYEALLRAVLATLPVGLLVTDREGRIVLSNQAAERLWGELREGDDMIDRYSQTTACWADTGKPIGINDWPLWRAVRDGESMLNAAIELERNGERRFLFKSAVPLRDATGQFTGAVIVDQDITDRHRAEQQLGETQAHLAQAQKLEAVGRLAGGIAHDFNNLLTVINALSLAILKRLPAADPNRADLEEIHGAGERAANLTRQLLAFSRRQVLQQEVLDLNTVVLGVGRMLGRLIGEDITLRFPLAPDLNPIRADRGQLEQVIINLALNARDAMPGGGALTIETANVQVRYGDGDERLGLLPGDYVKLVVSDTGTGMDEMTQAHIFEPFFTTKRQGEGTGLGLATVYGIVQQSGGGIAVSSAPGQGSAFTIYLPQAAQTAEPEQPRDLREAAGGSEVILLVEDEPSVRRLTANLLRGYGYAVLEVSGGQQAIELARAAPRPIDLLLTDVVMPGLSGPELAEQLRAQLGDFRVLYMSGYSDLASRHGYALEGAPLLQKPFTPEGLGRKVREVLDAGSPAEQLR